MPRVAGKILPLTAFRFFAAAVVLLGHSSTTFSFGAPFFDWIPAHQGVTMFFVLSGFILTYSYPELPTSADVLRFLVARFARVWPLHFTTFLLALALIPDLRAAILKPEGALYALLNVTMTHALVPTLASQFSFNRVSWSISTEMFFYVCFIILIARRDGPIWVLLLLGALGPLIMVGLSIGVGLPVYDPAMDKVSGATMYYIHPLGRVLDFVIGIVTALIFQRHQQRLRMVFERHSSALEVVAVALTVVAMFGLTYVTWARPMPFASPHMFLWLERSGTAPIYALTIFVLAFSSGAVSRQMSRPICVLLGEMSFAIYLTHELFMRWIAANSRRFEGMQEPMVFVGYLLVTLIVSGLLWKFVEQPARKVIVMRS